MAKLYDKGSTKRAEQAPPEAVLAAIQTFLSSCRRPAMLELGEELIPLTPGQFALEIRSAKVWIECFSETRSVSRKIVAVERQKPGVLDCTIQRFGGKPGKLSFLDLDRPQTAHKSLFGERQNFSEQFRRMLFRQFPGWEIPTLSCGMDLQRSFSPVFPRARLTRGNAQIAAMACPTPGDESALLTFALLWHDYVCQSNRTGLATTLCLFLPDTAGNLSAHRLRWLRSGSLHATLFRFNQDGMAGEVDAQDLGNLETHLNYRGVDAQRASSAANQVPDFNPAIGSSQIESERWLEVCVRANPLAIDPFLCREPVHSQVITFAATDRNLIDLLGVCYSGRLTVLELKTSEDIHLPLQALDYWMRVKWHSERDELRPLFPGIALESGPPRLLLVAPAMSFHSTNATILRYFSSEIEVERVGINSEWQKHLKVVLRLKGADSPISHGSLE